MPKHPQRPKLLTKSLLVSLGLPAVFIPGLILASLLGWNWQKDFTKLIERGGFYQNLNLFPQQAVVAQVIDGDTLELKNGRTIRLVGVDAPNRGEPYFGQALEYTISLVEDQKVKLEYDAYQDDKFGRILAYVLAPCTTQKGCQDGQLMLNQGLVENGLAKVVIYSKRKKLKYQEELLSAEEEAKKQDLNLWKTNQ